MSSHNKLFGKKIPHPASTKFDDFGSPSAKRLKTRDSLDSSLSRASSPEGGDIVSTPRPESETADCEDENEGPGLGSQTQLETALPPVRTDKEAIAEYEATRAAQQASAAFLQDRLESRTWTRGKNSIYVDAFNLALETVLEEEGHLFDEAESKVFEIWQALSYEAQYLYVRLFLRKTAAWFRINRLGYHNDIGNLDDAIAELLELRDLPKVESKLTRHAGEIGALPQDNSISDHFSFADSSDEGITTLEDASSLLLLDELKVIAKDVKAQGKTKKELLQALRRTSKSQAGLGWGGLKRSDTEESIKSEVSHTSEMSDDGKENRDAHLIKKIMASTGQCIRLSAAPHKLFERVHLVFYRSTEWTEKSLTVIILARISRRNFPEYIVSRSTNIFVSRAMLLEFEASLRTQFTVDNLIEGYGPVMDNLQKVKDIFEDVYPRWREILAEEEEKEARLYETGEGAYLRRFSPGWVYTRIVHKGLAPLARFKEHKKEHDLLTELLGQRLFHPARRGAWYQRKALLEEHYMAALEPNYGRNEEAQKRHWKRIALRTCEQGLQDRDCHVIYHYDLQKRILKLEKSIRVAKREQHEFAHTSLAKPVERTVQGIRIEKVYSNPGSRRSSEVNITRRGTKTIWLDEHEGGGECGVEAMCLSWYRTQGWKGFHSEGGIIRTLVSLESFQFVHANTSSLVTFSQMLSSLMFQMSSRQLIKRVPWIFILMHSIRLVYQRLTDVLQRYPMVKRNVFLEKSTIESTRKKPVLSV